MNISKVSFGKTVKMNCTQREANLVAMLSNGTLKPRNQGEKKLAKSCKEIFNDIKPLDVKTQADVFYVGADTYVLSGEDAKKASRLREKWLDTRDDFYYFKMEEYVEKTQETFAIILKKDKHQNRKLEKVNIIG